jgi:hypothetical protein
MYLAIFNISDSNEPEEILVDLTELGLGGDCAVKNMWTGEDYGMISGIFSQQLSAHACGLFKLTQ